MTESAGERTKAHLYVCYNSKSSPLPPLGDGACLAVKELVSALSEGYFANSLVKAKLTSGKFSLEQNNA